MRSDLTAGFFDELASRGHEPLLRKVTGSARFDVVTRVRTERWLVTIDKGDIRVSRENGPADSVLRADKASWDRAVAGELNLMAAVLRGRPVSSAECDSGCRLAVKRCALAPCGPPFG